MKFIISGKNLDVTDGLKAAIEEKIGKLERYFTPETEVHVTSRLDRKSTRLNSSHYQQSRMPSSA